MTKQRGSPADHGLASAPGTQQLPYLVYLGISRPGLSCNSTTTVVSNAARYRSQLKLGVGAIPNVLCIFYLYYVPVFKLWGHINHNFVSKIADQASASRFMSDATRYLCINCEPVMMHGYIHCTVCRKDLCEAGQTNDYKLQSYCVILSRQARNRTVTDCHPNKQ